MSSASRTIWRRFFLLDPKTEWSAAELKRQPELHHLPPTDPYAKQWLVGRCLGFWVDFGIVAACMLVYTTIWQGLCSLILVPLVTTHITSSPWLAYVLLGANLCAILGLGVGTMLASSYVAKRRKRSVRSELRCRGIPICVKCGYEGGDMSAPRCPECGAVHPASGPS